jgi:hypothetical protein
MKKFKISVWDSLTGEVSGHEVNLDPSIGLAHLADHLHSAVCEDTGETPEDWKIIATMFTQSVPVVMTVIMEGSRDTVNKNPYTLSVMTAVEQE